MAKGRVARLFQDDFAVDLENIDPHRTRLSQYLVWLVRGVEHDLDEDSRYDRIVPLNRIMTLSCPDGSKNFGRVQNVSRSGIAFTSTAALAVGEAVVIGRHPARIVRLFDDGAAAAFGPSSMRTASMSRPASPSCSSRTPVVITFRLTLREALGNLGVFRTSHRRRT